MHGCLLHSNAFNFSVCMAGHIAAKNTSKFYRRHRGFWQWTETRKEPKLELDEWTSMTLYVACSACAFSWRVQTTPMPKQHLLLFPQCLELLALLDTGGGGGIGVPPLGKKKLCLPMWCCPGVPKAENNQKS